MIHHTANTGEGIIGLIFSYAMPIASKSRSLPIGPSNPMAAGRPDPVRLAATVNPGLPPILAG